MDRLMYLDTGEIFSEVEDGPGEPRLVATMAGELSDDTHAEGQMLAAAPALYGGVEKAVKTFRTYAALHKAKGNAEGDAKAAANSQLANELEALLSAARWTPDR